MLGSDLINIKALNENGQEVYYSISKEDDEYIFMSICKESDDVDTATIDFKTSIEFQDFNSKFNSLISNSFN